MPLDELHRFEVAPIDKVLFAWQALVDFLVEVVWIEVASATYAATFRDNNFIEAVLSWRDFLCTVVGITGEVPFSDDACVIAGPL